MLPDSVQGLKNGSKTNPEVLSSLRYTREGIIGEVLLQPYSSKSTLKLIRISLELITCYRNCQMRARDPIDYLKILHFFNMSIVPVPSTNV